MNCMKRIAILFLSMIMAVVYMPVFSFAGTEDANVDEPALTESVVTEESEVTEETENTDPESEDVTKEDVVEALPSDTAYVKNEAKGTRGAAEIIGSGKCGESVRWTLDSEGLLTISGEGLMNNYSSGFNNPAPWFNNRDNITAVSIENGVTSIGDYAFRICNNLTNISIPPSVTSIGSNAFYNCRSLTGINIPESVTSIGDYAFYSCSSITSIDIPDSLTSIENYTFASCSSLTDIEIPNSVTSIGNVAFYGCSSLTSIDIPERVISIGNSAFGSCSSLTSITIPDGVTSIERDTFNGCSNLTNIEIPNGVISIGSYAFYRCSSLASIDLPDSVTSIGYNAFENCSGLTSIKIPDGVISIERSTFRGCNNLTNISIPSSVTSIGTNAFSGCSSLASITIPNGVTSIEEYTFAECSSLTSIEIPDSVTSIGDYAFNGCSSLTSITIPSSVTSIGDNSFSGINSGYHVYADPGSTAAKYFPADHIVYPGNIIDLGTCGDNLTWTLDKEGLLTITGEGSMSDFSNVDDTSPPWFNNRDNITAVTIESGVTSIGSYAFRNCSNLTSIEIPDSVTGISSRAFHGCSSLVSIDIPNGVTSIGHGAFAGCSSLTSIDIPDGVTSIGNMAFYGCSSLVSIDIPNGVTSIVGGAFDGCSSLTSIEIPDSVTSIGISAFRDCSSLASINIPDGVTSIENYTFADCSSLTSINIPNSVTSIGRGAFEDCSSLVSITIPASVTSIDSPAFSGINNEYIIYTFLDSYASTYYSEFYPSHIRYLIASIGESFYVTVQAAIDAANEYDRVKLLADIGESISIPSEKNLSLDLNGHTLSGITNKTIENSGKLLIIDTNDTGAITAISNDSTAILNQGSLTIRSGAITGSIMSTDSQSTMTIEGGTINGTIAASNPSGVHIRGGRFSNDPSQYLDSDYMAVMDGDMYKVVDVVRVTVKSMEKDSGEEITPVSGGGAYAIGSEATVKAPSVYGYDFIGWYEYFGGPIDDEIDMILSTKETYTFVVETGINLVAVYKVNETSGKAELTVSGGEFRVNGGPEQMLNNYSQKFDLNTVITLEATGDDFLYWMNSSKKIVSRDATYTFTLVRDISLTAVYKRAADATAYVEFVSAYGQIMQAQNYSADSDITLPSGPSKSGHTFVGWDMTIDEIKAEISQGETYICVNPEYEAISGTFSLTKVYDGEAEEAEQLAGYQKYTLEAKDIEGRKFAYWQDDLGNKLSTSNTYKYYLDRDATVEAVYVDEDEPVTEEPLIAITSVTGKANDGRNTIFYTIIKDVPEGYTVQDNGVIFSTNSVYGEEGGAELLIPGAQDVRLQQSSNTNNKGVISFTLNTNNKADVVVYLKGYMTVQNNATGETETIYTGMISKSYNEIKEGE